MQNNKKVKRQKCQIFSRVVGFYRATSQFNDAKVAEHAKRVNFKV